MTANSYLRLEVESYSGQQQTHHQAQTGHQRAGSGGQTTQARVREGELDLIVVVERNRNWSLVIRMNEVFS